MWSWKVECSWISPPSPPFSLGWMRHTHPFMEYEPVCPCWAVAGLHAAIDDPTSPVGGTGRPLRPRCTGGLRVWKPACSADAPSPVRTGHTHNDVYPQLSTGFLRPAASYDPTSCGSEILCVFMSLTMSPTFVGLASNMIWVMEAGGRMGLNGASSVPDGGCSFTFIDWWGMKGLQVSTVFLCFY